MLRRRGRRLFRIGHGWQHSGSESNVLSCARYRSYLVDAIILAPRTANSACRYDLSCYCYQISQAWLSRVIACFFYTEQPIILWITLRITCAWNVSRLPNHGQKAPSKSPNIQVSTYLTMAYTGLFELDGKERMHVRTNSFLASKCA